MIRKRNIEIDVNQPSLFEAKSASGGGGMGSNNFDCESMSNDMGNIKA